MPLGDDQLRKKDRKTIAMKNKDERTTTDRRGGDLTLKTVFNLFL